MIRAACALVVGAVLTGFAFLLLAAKYPEDGPVLVTITEDHGVHLGDLFVVGGWAVAMLALLVLARASTRRRAAVAARAEAPSA